jgi:hypothetical protein
MSSGMLPKGRVATTVPDSAVSALLAAMENPEIVDVPDFPRLFIRLTKPFQFSCLFLFARESFTAVLGSVLLNWLRAQVGAVQLNRETRLPGEASGSAPFLAAIKTLKEEGKNHIAQALERGERSRHC